MKLRIFTGILLNFLCLVWSDDFQADFKPGAWQAADWMHVKTPRLNYMGKWVQHADHIENSIPEEAKNQQGAGEIYTSMLWKKSIPSKQVLIHSRMSFDERMAPLIVWADQCGMSADGRYKEYREHWEVVLFDQGINVWHHEFKDGKASFQKVAQLQASFQPRTVYDLKVSLHRRKGQGHEIIIACGGRVLKYQDPGVPEEIQVGITGCEGVNRFYDFGVKYK